jgi:hypothetical protein
MRQRIIGLRQLRISGWLLAALLIAVFLINNRELVSGARVQIWDAWSFYTPAFSLVADHARSGRLLLWDPWLAGGTPDFADPQVAAASPIAIIAGAIGGGNSTAFRIYWLFIWVLGPLGLPCWHAISVLLARVLSWWRWGTPFAIFIQHMPSTQILYSSRLCPGLSGGLTWR